MVYLKLARKTIGLKRFPFLWIQTFVNGTWILIRPRAKNEQSTEVVFEFFPCLVDVVEADFPDDDCIRNVPILLQRKKQV